MSDPEQPSNRVFDPLQIIRVLAAHHVQYVLIGATAARLQGFPRLTADADITPSIEAENLVALCQALTELDARIFVDGIPDGLPFEIEARTLSRADIWNLITNAGRLDIIFRPLGTDGYADLLSNSVEFRIENAAVHAASIADIIRCKLASNRVQDRADIPILEALLKRT